MPMIHRTLIVCTLVAGSVTVAAPAAAQRGTPPGRAGGPGTPANRPRATVDTTRKASAVALDFQDQELRVVLDAVAAAGELNVVLGYIPSQRISLHMGRPVNREGMIDVLKQI